MKDLMQKGFSRKRPGVTSLLLVLAIGLTLTVMIAGISALSIREQQQASNTELSNKALQAAESGVKLALQKLNDDPSFSTPANTCKKLEDLGISNSTNVGSNSEITCIEVKNVFTGSYEGKIERDKATQVFIGGQACPTGQNPDGSCIGGVVIANKGANNFQFRWHSKTLDQTLADYTNTAIYPVVEGYKSAASIEMTFIYWPRAVGFTQVKSATVFFVPGQTDSGYSAAAGRTPLVTDCAANSTKNGNYRCGIGGNLGINLKDTLGLPLAGENYNFAIRIKPYYADTHFEATALIDSSTNTVPIQSSKAQIDVTAKTNNLYRRVKAEKVIIPSAVENIFESTIYSASTGTLGSNAGICKTIVVLKDNTLAPNQPACN